MNPRRLELALRRQRLQLLSADQREGLAEALGGLAPAFAAIERVREGVRSLLRHPEWLAGAAVVLVVARPRAVMRWARRGIFVWQISRRIRDYADSVRASGTPHRT
jgi:hypothetical protein